MITHRLQWVSLLICNIYRYDSLSCLDFSKQITDLYFAPYDQVLIIANLEQKYQFHFNVYIN